MPCCYEITLKMKLLRLIATLLSTISRIWENRKITIKLTAKERLFQQAAADGDREACRAWLQPGNKFDVNMQDELGRTALHFAARRGQLGVVKMLLSVPFGADINLQDHLGNTSLFNAAWHGQIGTLRYLLKRKANPALSNKSGRTPLHAAVENGHVDCVDLLLNAGACVHAPDSQGYSPVHSAAQIRRSEVLKALIESGANIDLHVQGKLLTPLHIAAGYGNKAAVKLLLESGADTLAVDKHGMSALEYAAIGGCDAVVDLFLEERFSAPTTVDVTQAYKLACQYGHTSAVLRLLNHVAQAGDNKALFELLSDSGKHSRLDQELQRLLRKSEWRSCKARRSFTLSGSSTDVDIETLSTKLHKRLSEAGFTENGAKVQMTLADTLEQILQHRWHQSMHIVGSYSDGWGNSLRCANGRTDLDADIDVADFSSPLVFHIEGFCKCPADTTGSRKYFIYKNGHIFCPDVASNPTQSWGGSVARPSIDSIPGLRCCCYPEIHLSDKLKSRIHPDVIAELELIVKLRKAHLVAAAIPGREGEQLRLSTSFLERRLMRSLSTVQGQTFIIIKHLVKQVLCRDMSAEGLKTYHAKTLFFYLLEETPVEQWQPENLAILVKRALELLQENLESDSGSNYCMKHFFLKDAIIYLKRYHNTKAEIATAVRHLIADLPYFLSRFMLKVRQIPAFDEVFHFDPFLILPDPNPQTDGLSGSVGTIPSVDVYNAVFNIWTRLASSDHSSEDYESLMRDASRLPDCAATVRCCLRVLANLKYSKIEEAKTELSSLPKSCEDFIRFSDLAMQDDVKMFVKKKLETCDWAIKFCFVFASHPELTFLPNSVRPHFPICILYVNVFFLNFQALYKGLCIEFGVADKDRQMTWFRETQQQDEAKLQEILLMLEFCKDRKMVLDLIRKHRRAICAQKDTRDKVQSLMKTDPELQRLSVIETLEEVFQRLESEHPIDTAVVV